MRHFADVLRWKLDGMEMKRDPQGRLPCKREYRNGVRIREESGQQAIFRKSLSFHLTNQKNKRITIMDFIKDLWGFLKVRKKFWLMPIILVLVLFGALIAVTGGTAIAPFIYAVF